MGQEPEPDDLGRIVDALVDSGIGRPLPLPPLWLPPVWIDSGRLCWGLKNWDAPREVRMPNLDRLLPHFIALADGSDKMILEFAKKYGPLALCAKHGDPIFHAPGCEMEECFEPPDSREGATEQQNRRFIERIVFTSSLNAWRFWATWVRTFLRLAAATKANRPGNPRDWIFILGSGREPSPETDRRDLIARAANSLLQLAQPSPIVALDASGNLQLAFVNNSSRRLTPGHGLTMPKVENPTSGTLFAAIAVATASSLAAGGKPLLRCCACRRIYTPRRLPGPGERNFCHNCGARASWRLSKRLQRAQRAQIRGSK